MHMRKNREEKEETTFPICIHRFTLLAYRLMWFGKGAKTNSTIQTSKLN